MMERETREKYGVRDKKKKGVRQGGLGGRLCTRGLKGIQGFFVFLFNFFNLRVVLIRDGVELSRQEKKRERNSSRIPCDSTADEAKPLPQLEKTNLTHLWIPFNLQKEKKKILLQEKK